MEFEKDEYYYFSRALKSNAVYQTIQVKIRSILKNTIVVVDDKGNAFPISKAIAYSVLHETEDQPKSYLDATKKGKLENFIQPVEEKEEVVPEEVADDRDDYEQFSLSFG